MVQGPPANERESITQIKSSSVYGVPHGRMGWSSPSTFQSSKKNHCTAKDSNGWSCQSSATNYYLAVQGRRKSRDKPLNISNGDKKNSNKAVRDPAFQVRRSLEWLSGIAFSLSVGHVSTILSSIVIHRCTGLVLSFEFNASSCPFYIIQFVQYINGYTTTCSLHQILQNSDWPIPIESRSRIRRNDYLEL